MDLQYITPSDWEHLRTTYPDAASFLLRASLIGEWEHLLRKNDLNAWERRRLNELNDRFLEKKGG